jgi:hypothetical protein
MSDYLAAAVIARWGEGVDGTLKAVERVLHIRLAWEDYLKGFVVVVTAYFALSH